tara:strand:- start:264 stop:1028 length:765 start_codon:yes stop_codon:yes gene_type:complete
MKKILLILLISQSLFSQIKYIESDTDSYIDFTNKVVKLKFENHSIEGKYINVDGKDFYTYMVINGGNDVWVVRELSKMGIMGMDILKGDYNTILKEFKKGRKYKKSQLLFSNLPASDVMKGYRLISESEKERYEKMNKSKLEFDSKIKDNEFLGIYKIKILKHRNLDYKDVDTFGKIIITEVGITIETDIPSVDLLRGSYIKETTDLEKGRFSCRINKGYGDLFSLSLNKESSVGGLSTISGRNTTTTIFKILE